MLENRVGSFKFFTIIEIHWKPYSKKEMQKLSFEI